MILVDVSSILHRMIYGATKNVTLTDNKMLTEDFIYLAMHYILGEFIDIQVRHKQYGELVLCFDDYKKTYWRRDFYPEYKSNRRDTKALAENPINYQEVYEYTNKLFDQIKNNTPWKCVYVNRAEADDIILVLASTYYTNPEGILILSPDKDFVQCQRNPNIAQYSALTKKWITPETKSTDMEHWLRKHVILGDGGDGVPKIIDHTEFSEAFISHLKKHNAPLDVKTFNEMDIQSKRIILEDYDAKTYNRKGQETGYDIYKVRKFGITDVDKIFNGTWKLKLVQTKLQEKAKSLREQKKLETDPEIKRNIQNKIKKLREQIKNLKVDDKTELERLDEFLDSHPLYREHYDRNFMMVMEEGIPDYIRANILLEYNTANTEYNEDEFINFLEENHLGTLKAKLPLVFNTNTKLDITNHGWDW